MIMRMRRDRFTMNFTPEDGFLGGEHDHAHAQRQVHNERVLQVKEEGDVLQVLAVSEACNKES